MEIALDDIMMYQTQELLNIKKKNYLKIWQDYN